MDLKYDVIVTGAGAAGLMAAVTAGRGGARVCLLDRNEKPGKKIYITGKGRCNLTNLCDPEDFFPHIVTNRKFMYSSFYAMTNLDVVRFFEDLGLRTKTERGNRVFPASDKASDVTRALWTECQRLQVDARLSSDVEGLLAEQGRVKGVRLSGRGGELYADSVILAAGGRSYAATGSDGSGCLLAESAGHRIVPCRPGLVPMNLKEPEPKRMQGLSLKNVEVCFYTRRGGSAGKKKELYREFGEMMFTHFGITGPIVLSASSYIGDVLGKETVYAELDCKPALSADKLHRRIIRDFEANPNSSLKNVAGGLLPKSMVPVALDLAALDGTKPVNRVTKEERERLVHTLKAMTFTVESLRGWNEAIITRGGIDVRDVNPSTMESRLVKNLYFAGEILDVDALTGGFNLQVAWSTGFLAGESAAGSCANRNGGTI